MPADTFQTFIRTWLADRKLSPEEAAPILGVGHVCIYSWMNGSSRPTLPKAPVLAPILAIDEDRLRVMLRRPKRRR